MKEKKKAYQWAIQAIRGLREADYGSVTSPDGKLTESIVLKSRKAFDKQVLLGCGIIAVGLVLTIISAYYGGGDAYMVAEEDALEKIGCFK